MVKSLGELIGPMLGAKHVCGTGLLRVQEFGGEVHSERFWFSRRGSWRLDRDDGLRYVQNEEQGSATFARGRLTEVGPLIKPFFLPEQIVYPGNALIWGRPGEDWRLSDEVQSLGGDLFRMELIRTDDDPRYPDYTPRAHVCVDATTGALMELVRDDWAVITEELDVFSPVDRELFDWASAEP